MPSYLSAFTASANVLLFVRIHDEFINQAVNIIHNHFSLYSVNLYLIENSKEWALLRVGTGVASQVALEQDHKLPVDGNSMIGKAISSGKSQVALDDKKQQIPFPSAMLPLVHSELVVPFKAQNGDIVGALDIQSSD